MPFDGLAAYAGLDGCGEVSISFILRSSNGGNAELNLQMGRSGSVQWKEKDTRKIGEKKKIIRKEENGERHGERERRGMKWKGEEKKRWRGRITYPATCKTHDCVVT